MIHLRDWDRRPFISNTPVLQWTDGCPGNKGLFHPNGSISTNYFSTKKNV